MKDETNFNAEEIMQATQNDGAITEAEEHHLTCPEDQETNATNTPANDAQLVETLQKELAAAKAKADENWDRVLRTNAEMENMRKRARVDIDNASKFANERFSKELLSIVDSLEKALEVVTGADPATDNTVTSTTNSAAMTSAEHSTAIREGINLTYKLLLDTLDKFGIKMLNPLGETFNPSKHEALAMQATNDAAANSVILVAQKGFTIHDRVLRPARVIVAKPME